MEKFYEILPRQALVATGRLGSFAFDTRFNKYVALTNLVSGAFIPYIWLRKPRTCSPAASLSSSIRSSAESEVTHH